MTDVGEFSWVRLIYAFTVVIALMAALAYVLKYISMRGFVLPTGKGWPAKTQRRMAIVETLPVDAKRRFVILRCVWDKNICFF